MILACLCSFPTSGIIACMHKIRGVIERHVLCSCYFYIFYQFTHNSEKKLRFTLFTLYILKYLFNFCILKYSQIYNKKYFNRKFYYLNSDTRYKKFTYRHVHKVIVHLYLNVLKATLNFCSWKERQRNKAA